MAPREAERPPRRHRESGAHRHKRRRSSSKRHRSGTREPPSEQSSHPLSAGALERLNRQNAINPPHKRDARPKAEPERRPKKKARGEEYRDSGKPKHRGHGGRDKHDRHDRHDRHGIHGAHGGHGGHDDHRGRSKRRVVSGAILEEGKGGRLRGGALSSEDSLEKDKYYPMPASSRNRKKRRWIYIGIGLAIIIVIIVVAVVVSKKSSPKSGLDGISRDSIPPGAPSWLDPFQWANTDDFNLTYTDHTVGDLPVMGLHSSWDDSKAANGRVPALDEKWGSYGDRPARGVNLGGWLSLEPFITPSLFNYESDKGIVDEYTLCAYLAARCASTLEQHYATFVTEDTFREIADAGLDHVRIPYSYWAVQTYDGDPYLFRTSWRYLLRGIEWARKHGLRVNLDVHGLPGSQNGWNHSGRQGMIGWMNGTNGDVNVQRSLDMHDRLSKFFAQDRYRNIISHYGLANEPKMTFLPASSVIDWTGKVHNMVRSNGMKDTVVVFGDGFMGLNKWQGKLTGLDNLALDIHQYVIFNNNQIVYNHTAKVRYACEGWTQQTEQSMDTKTGFGPTLVAEWSQADTDCATYLTNVGLGNRWTGTYNTGDPDTEATTPRCPTTDDQCKCDVANDQSQWSSAYKKFLRMFAEAQMTSFEKGWGWFYWVWDTESSPQWSYKKGMAAGILPAKAYERDFDCTQDIPDFAGAGLPEYY